MASYTVTVRNGPRVTRERCPTVAAAVDLLEERLSSLGAEARRTTAKAFLRELEPGAQVSARGEISGPGDRPLGRLHAGADIRGDGSVEAYRGRVRRELIPREPGETAFDALRRALGG
jgi:hypothetical protein